MTSSHGHLVLCESTLWVYTSTLYEMLQFCRVLSTDCCYPSHTAALRFCRRIVGLKDDFFNRYVIRNNLFSPIVKTMIANGQRYNLVNSAIIELFKFITMVMSFYCLSCVNECWNCAKYLFSVQEKVTCLIIYTVDNFMAALDNVEYVDTFKRLKLAYDQERDRLENPSPASTVWVYSVCCIVHFVCV